MYKVFIVDNEKAIRTGLSKGIIWETLNCKVIGTAENGKAALEMIKKQQPDIVISDVKMDEMDGLQLCSTLQKLFPLIRCILVTGYQDFSTAYTAANEFNITKLILKPTSVFRITQAIQETIASIEKDNTASLRQRENLQLRRKIILSNIIASKETDIALQQSLDSVELNLNNYFMLCIFLDEPNSTVDIFSKDAVLNYIDQIFTPGAFIRFSHPNNNNAIMILVLEATAEIESRFEDMCLELANIIEACTEFSIYIGLSSRHTSSSTIYQSIFESEHAAQFAQYTIHSPFATNEMIPASAEDASKSILHQPLQNVLNNIQSLNTETTLSKFKEMYALFIDNQFPISDFRELCLLLCSAATQQMVLYEEQFAENHLEIQAKARDKIYSCHRFEQLYLTTSEFLTENIHKPHNVSSSQKLIQEVEVYIKNNFSENLTLESIATVFFISPSYLSRLFKSSIGINLTTYIQNIRISYAKELAISTTLPAYQIAESVGITDPVYFSKLFKKLTGKGIREYRMNYRNNDVNPTSPTIE